MSDDTRQLVEYGDERLPERFWTKVSVVETGCWEWAAGKTRDGYGHFWLLGRHQRAHRVAYVALVGPIGEELECDHTCRNRSCVNPLHIEPVSHTANMRRVVFLKHRNTVKTHCIRGHEFNDENTVVFRNGWRTCRRCKAAATKRSFIKKQATHRALRAAKGGE